MKKPWIPVIALAALTANGASVLPGAVGFGTETQAGRGGRVVTVTSLDSTGPGSLRAALETRGPRIIVFEVAGVIDLQRNNLVIAEPFVTVAAQTAPRLGSPSSEAES
jgi:hypothetical protein